MTTYIGIDPGLHGAIAVVGHADDLPEFHSMPTIAGKGGKTILSEGGVLDLFRHLQRTCSDPVAILERSQTMPGQGSVSGFTIGYQLGCLRMALLAAGIPTYLVAPVSWKKRVFSNLPPLESKEKKALKDRSIEVARNLYPGVVLVPEGCRVPSPDRAEALLLAHYGRMENLVGGANAPD